MWAIYIFKIKFNQKYVSMYSKWQNILNQLKNNHNKLKQKWSRNHFIKAPAVETSNLKSNKFSGIKLNWVNYNIGTLKLIGLYILLFIITYSGYKN